MCGIYAYLNINVPRSKREIVEILLNGISRMEYRGYDSAGIALDSPIMMSTLLSSEDRNRSDSLEDSKELQRTSSGSYTNSYLTKIIKSQGKVSKLQDIVWKQKDIDFDTVIKYHIGIAHTRWATHGMPSDINAHPQSSDPNNEFVVVHNGIISNYKEIRTLLEKYKIYQKSETDTELIVLLIKYIYDKYKDTDITFLDLANIAIGKLEGAFAIVIKSSHFPNECIVTRRSSPLIIGIKNSEISNNERFNIRYIDNDDIEKNLSPCKFRVAYKRHRRSRSNSANSEIEYFIASDASAIIEHTKNAIYLEENDVAYIDQNGELSIHQLASKSTEQFEPQYRDLCRLDIELEQIMKGNFETYMEKEIYEQPESLMNVMRGRIDFTNHQVILGGLRNNLSKIIRCRRIILIACGTSYHSAVAARPFLDKMVDLPVIVEIASDFTDRKMPVFRDDACIFISQSGETADTLLALRHCKEMGAILIGITNVVGSTISRETNCGVHLNAGPEIGVASTKAYTSQILTLNMIGCLLAQDSVSRRQITLNLINEVSCLPEIVKKTLQVHEQVKHIANEIKDVKNMLIIGRGYHYATCLEASLKVKELSYIHSEGMLSGELKHGTLALVDSELCIIMVIAFDSLYEKSLSALEQILSRNAKPIIICDEKCVIDPKRVKGIIRVPYTIDSLQVITSIIPFQFLALELAKFRGHNVDFPRNLAKSVTVE